MPENLILEELEASLTKTWVALTGERAMVPT